MGKTGWNWKKQEETGRNRKTRWKKTPKVEGNWIILKEFLYFLYFLVRKVYFGVRVILIFANHENKRDTKLYQLSLHSFCFTVSKTVLVFEFRPILGMWALFFKNRSSKVKNENCRMAMFVSLKEASWCTDCNAKNSMDHFWKNETWPSKMYKKNWAIFFF